MISEAEFLGMLILALVALIGLFSAVYKPLSENTKAMTKLGLQIQYLGEKIEEDRKEHEKHLKDFEDYKSHVSDGQKKQWDAIRENSKQLQKHDLELEHLHECENLKIGGK